MTTVLDSTPLLKKAITQLAEADIELCLSKKRVKNINFRLKPHQLSMSVPQTMDPTQIAVALSKRVPWALANHPAVLLQEQRRLSYERAADSPVMLWGTRQAFHLATEQKLDYYREQLKSVTPSLFNKWQPIVDAYAREVRFKKMHTRWGSCNTRARRVWLSVYLPAFPVECTEYVIVHELCHLHHANHSRAFWQTVATAMPEYQQWHNLLAGKRHVD